MKKMKAVNLDEEEANLFKKNNETSNKPRFSKWVREHIKIDVINRVLGQETS